jgi:hypothetical protein
MEEVFNEISQKLIEVHRDFINFLPKYVGDFFNLFILVLLIVLYALFVWKFYRFVAKKNIIELNLNKYNRSEHPILVKVLAVIFYFIEYIILLPFLIFFWFSIFTLFLIFLSESLEVINLLVISATIIAAIRMTSYYKEALAKDLAKLLPFTLLAISILNPNFFNIERILGHLSEIPGLFSEIIIFLVFIIILEMILRFFDFIFSLFNIEEAEEKTKKIEEDELKEE